MRRPIDLHTVCRNWDTLSPEARDRYLTAHSYHAKCGSLTHGDTLTVLDVAGNPLGTFRTGVDYRAPVPCEPTATPTWMARLGLHWGTEGPGRLGA
jgi:hypothetical protein